MTGDEQRAQRQVDCALNGHVYRRSLHDDPATRCLHCGNRPRYRIVSGNGKWFDIEPTDTPGHFLIIGDNVTEPRDRFGRDFQFDSTWENLDTSSDPWQLFGISQISRRGDVVFTPDSVTGPSIARILEAARHTRLRAWCPDDI